MGKTRTVKTTIATLLSEVVGTTKNIRKIYGYFESAPTEFPCVMVFLKGISEDRLDFGNNQVNANYQIKLCLPLGGSADREEIENLRLDCIDDIMDRLRKSDAVETLGGDVFKTSFTAGEPYEELEAEFPMLVTDFLYETARSEMIVSA